MGTAEPGAVARRLTGSGGDFVSSVGNRGADWLKVPGSSESGKLSKVRLPWQAAQFSPVTGWKGRGQYFVDSGMQKPGWHRADQQGAERVKGECIG